MDVESRTAEIHLSILEGAFVFTFLETCEYRISPGMPFDEEPLMITELLERFTASEETGFENIGASVFWTEDVTVPTFIAEIGKVRNLILFFQFLDLL